MMREQENTQTLNLKLLLNRVDHFGFLTTSEYFMGMQLKGGNTETKLSQPREKRCKASRQSSWGLPGIQAECILALSLIAARGPPSHLTTTPLHPLPLWYLHTSVYGSIIS